MNLHDRDIERAAKKEGIAQGAAEKAVEAAVIAVRSFNVSPQLAAMKMEAPLDKVLDRLEKKLWRKSYDRRIKGQTDFSCR